MIFISDDIRKHCYLIAIRHQTHGHPRHRLFYGHTGVHKGKAAPADRCHGGRTIGFKDLGNNSDAVLKFLLIRNYRQKRASGKGPMADIPAAGPAKSFRLSHTVGREIVVQYEGPEMISVDGFHPLFIPLSSQGSQDHGLGLASGKKGRSVNTRHHAYMTFDGSHLGKGAPVDPFPLLQDHLADHFLFKIMHCILDLRFFVSICLGQGFQDSIERFFALPLS